MDLFNKIRSVVSNLFSRFTRSIASLFKTGPLQSLLRRRSRESCNVVIVRRYITANGYIGEIYLDGRQIGVTCDNLALSGSIGPVWILPFSRSIGNGRIVLRYNEFTNRTPLDVCHVGSVDSKENKDIIRRLNDAIRGKQANLVVLERLWSDLGSR